MRTKNDLLLFIQNDPGLNQLLEFVQTRMKDDPHPDPGHDLAHFLRVALWATRLSEGKVDPRRIIAAALLHDVVNVPKNHPDRSRASELSAQVAREILPSHGFLPEEIDDIADAIRDHSYSRGAKPTRLLGMVIQDADRLEALGALGVMRAISTGTRMGSVYFHSDDPWARNREWDDRKFSVDHFFVKLFKLPDLMNTEAGRSEADRRARSMKSFLADLGEELGEPLAST